MNFDDIHVGDIAVAKDGTEYRIVDAKYITVLLNNKIRLDLSPIKSVRQDFNGTYFNGTYGFQYAWVGDIEDLKQTFDKVGKFRFNTNEEKAKQKIEQIYKELVELKRMIEDM